MKSRFPVSHSLLQIEPYPASSPQEMQAPVQLASNENCLGPSPHAIKAIERSMKDTHRYPEATGLELRKAIALRTNVTEQQVILGNGSTELVEILLRTYLEPGQNSVTADPTFVLYRIATITARGRCKEVPLTDDRYDLEAMLKAVDENTRVVLIANPNNPTGTMVRKKEMDRFLDTLPSQILVVLDEAYKEYVQNPEFPDGVEALRKHSNIIVLHSFSKIHGLAGLRIGYGIADAEIIANLNRVRSPYNTNHVAQAAALAALGDQKHIRRSKEANDRERVFIERELQARKIPYAPFVANFFYLPMENPSAVQQRLLKGGVFVRAVKDGLRVTLGTRQENVAFLNALGTPAVK